MRFVRAAIFVVITLAACGDSQRGPGVGGDGYMPPAPIGVPCAAGQKRVCSIEIGRDEKVVDCARGEQFCGTDGKWGACVGTGTTYKAVAPSPSKGSPASDLHTNTV